MDGTKRSEIKPGLEVDIVLKQDQRTGKLTRGVVPFHGHPWQWVQEIAPTFEIEGRTLGEFLAWMERETGWQVRWRESAAARQALANVLHGSVEGLPPEQALAAVLPTCGLAHRIDDGTVVVFAN